MASGVAAGAWTLQVLVEVWPVLVGVSVVPVAGPAVAEELVGEVPVVVVGVPPLGPGDRPGSGHIHNRNLRHRPVGRNIPLEGDMHLRPWSSRQGPLQAWVSRPSSYR